MSGRILNLTRAHSSALFRITLLALSCAALCSCASPGHTSPAAAAPDDSRNDQRLSELRADLREMVASARDKVFPALVNIEVVTLEYQAFCDGARGSVSGSRLV